MSTDVDPSIPQPLLALFLACWDKVELWSGMSCQVSICVLTLLRIKDLCELEWEKETEAFPP